MITSVRIGRQKRPRCRKIKAGITRQLDYLRQNLKAIDALIDCGALLSELERHWWKKVLACRELERQQGVLVSNKTNSIPDRLVSLVQTHLRPIVCGKARSTLTSRAKINVSAQKCFPFLHHIDWDPHHEGYDLIAPAESYRHETVSHPDRICAGQAPYHFQD